MADVQLELQPVYSGAAKFDLMMTVIEDPHQPTAIIEYDTDLFEPETIERMADHWQALLTAIVADPDQPITHLPLLSMAERRQMLVEWNDTAVPYPHDQTIHQLFAAQAAQTPQVTAVVAENGQLSYQELNQRANQLGHALQELGVKPGTIVGLCPERSVEMLVGLLGILKAGGAYLPLDPSYPTERLAFMLEDAQPTAVLTQVTIASDPWLSSYEQSPIICLDTDWPNIARQPMTNPTTATTGEDLAYLIYTSGSTGQPKGAMVPHRAALNLRTGLEEAIYKPLKPAPLRLSLNAPLPFDASVQQLIMLTRGHTIYVIPQEIRGDGEALLAYIRRHKLDVLDCVPSQLKVLLASGLLDDEGWVPTAVLPGGEAIDPATWQQLVQAPRTEFYNMYGPTECAVDSTIGHVKRYPARPTIGRPIANAQMYVLDNHLQPVPIGMPGELYIGGAGVGLGYLNRPELTAERFVQLSVISNQLAVSRKKLNTAYRTGDLVRYLPDGTLDFLGRVDHQVKIRGFRLELGEIEAVLRQHPDLVEVAVAAQATKSAPEDKHLVAYFVTAAETAVSSADLRQFLKPKLPEYMIPTFFVLLEAMPLTPNRKIDRRQLPQLDKIRATLTTDAVAPRTPQEEILAGIWAQVLGVEQIGIQDNFFALGGHSLLATQLVSRIRSTFQVALPLRTLFEAPTIAELAAKLSQTKTSDQIPVEPQLDNGRSQLSFAQQRLWFLDQLEPGSPLYNMTDAVRLSGPLDVIALERSLNEVVRRHEILRATFVTVNGQPQQHFLPQVQLYLPVVDLRPFSPTEQTEEIQERTIAESQRPFDLTKDPLLRTTLLQLADEEHIILVALHHIVADGWSVGLIINGVAAIYEALVAQQPLPLPEPTVKYSDYIHWQRQWLHGETIETQLDYWRQQLAGCPPLLELPTDRLRPAVQTYHGGKRPFVLPPALTQELKHLAEQEGVTLFMTLLAILQAQLYRYTNQVDFNIGTPVANRSQAELEKIIGLFVNTLVLRADLSGKPTFRQLLQRVRQTALAAYAHQDVPFEMIVDAIQPQRNLSHTPLFQVMLVLQNTPIPTQTMDSVTLAPIDLDGGMAKFDLTLFLVESGGELRGSWEFNSDLFDAETIKRMMGHFEELVRGVLTNVDQSIHRLPLLTAAEQHLLVKWNQTAADFPHDQCVHQLFEAQVEQTPRDTAVVYNQQQLTYTQLNRRANQLAHHLRQLGVGPETLVTICVERSLEMVIGLMGILKAGGAYVPLDPTYPPERLATMLQDAHPALILTQASLKSSQWLSENDQLVGSYPEVPPIIYLDKDWPSIAQASTENLVNNASPENLAYVIYTSGSTGRPKGTMLMHRGLVNYLTWCQQTYPVSNGQGAPIHSSISFDLTITGLFAPLLAGRTVHLLPEAPGVELLSTALQPKNDYSLVKITPAHLELLSQQIDPAAAAGLTHAFVIGGENLTGTSLAFWQEHAPGTALINEYGPTEAVVGCCVYKVGSDEQFAGSVPIGRPIINTQLYILDEWLQPVPVGVPGELYIGGAGVARGYLNRPALTAEKFVQLPVISNQLSSSRTLNTDHWSRNTVYRTGDLCRYRPDGNIEFLGRLDHQVKLHGFRIELGEIESVLSQHSAVQKTAVLLRQDTLDRKQLVAYVVPTNHMQPTVSELSQHLKQTLPDYMIPSAFVFLEGLPLSSNGKVDRRALPVPDQSRPDLDNAFVAPQTAAEKALAAIWQQLLNKTTIGVHDNFFELGGDSILTIQVVARAKEVGWHFMPRQLFQHPTIAQLAAVADTVPEVLAEQGIVTGLVPLTPIQKWFFDQNLPEMHHWNQAVMLTVPEELNSQRLKAAVSRLLSHHDALRLRFDPSTEGWQQLSEAMAEEVPFTGVDFSAQSAAEQKTAVAETANRLQASLNLSQGPLLQVAYFQLGAQLDQLLIIIHHLAIDGVSWRILLDDLQTAYQQLSQGNPVQLPSKTTSFQQWAQTLQAYAQSDSLAAERPYWQQLAQIKSAQLPLDYPMAGQANSEDSACTITSALSSTETVALLQEAPSAYGTDINDILLTALGQAVDRWLGTGKLLLDLEGHGREEIVDGIDLTRTVGWFTALYPVLLSVKSATEPGDALKTVKEQLRAVPQHGIGYGLLSYLCMDTAVHQQMAALPQPAISFNYLGQFDQTNSKDSLFVPSLGSTGNSRSLSGQRSHTLAISGGILQGQLKIEWTFSTNLHHRSTIERLAADFIEILRGLIKHCQKPEAVGYTASDFPDLDLSEEEIEALLEEVGQQ